MSRFNPVIVLALVVGTSTSSYAQRPTSPIGLWASEGYGLVLDVRADTVATFEVTKVSCIPDLRAPTSPPPAGALGAFTLTDAPVTFVLLPGPTASQARLHVAFAASDVIIHRIDRKPAICDTPTPNTPLSNFDVFAQTWAEHYPFFAEKKVDWAAVVVANRPRVSDATTPEQLFDILSGMIAPLERSSGTSAESANRRAFSRPPRIETPATRWSRRI
jgi:hypothetical protein